MLSSPRKPPANRLLPSASLRFTHQVKLSSSLWNTRARKMPVALAARPGHLVDAPARPRVHRRIHVAERELVRRDLPVRVHVPLAQEQHELLLGELGIDARERNHVEREVPRRVPRVLPLVRHRDDVAVVQVRQSRVAALRRAAGGGGCAGSPSSQSLDDVVIELLRPEQPRVRLARDARSSGSAASARSASRRTRPPRAVARRTSASNVATERIVGAPSVAQPAGAARTVAVSPGASVERVVAPPPWCPSLGRIHGVVPAVDDVLVERVLHVRLRVRQCRTAAARWSRSR